jgi:hypothetical protein
LLGVVGTETRGLKLKASLGKCKFLPEKQTKSEGTGGVAHVAERSPSQRSGAGGVQSSVLSEEQRKTRRNNVLEMLLVSYLLSIFGLV